ncbi:LOW QUALITY PROTEIN: transmembrane epididymal protein 1A-like [Acomys russatus]|uniref:LOW QUALITY PROTEIN: transmembrane epididymal protein 1A-like n=1 Tax=Acomys russatus TaxID=60746 RepID=UPI0021E29BC8|nr:LOW QUALITY PROTEIN: transmembrane epididymal protein 1A-like [Acomys russatus]
MGNGKFGGHFYPGLYIFFYGLYQATVVSKAMIVNDSPSSLSYFLKNKKRRSKLWKISYAGWLKIVTGSLLTFYVVFCLDDGMVLINKEMPPRFMYPQEWQHLTMFILLTLDGCVDVMSKNVLRQRCLVLERGVTVLSIYVVLLLLVSHVQVSSKVELHVHSLLILVVFLLMLVLTAELWAHASFCLQLMKSFLFLMMGSWLMHTGFILFRPVSGYPWKDDDISDITFVTTFFCWHVMTDALCMLGIYGVSSLWHCWYSPSWRLLGSKEALYHHESSSGSFYKLLQEAKHQDKDEQALLSKSSPYNKPRIPGHIYQSIFLLWARLCTYSLFLGEGNGHGK